MVILDFGLLHELNEEINYILPQMLKSNFCKNCSICISSRTYTVFAQSTKRKIMNKAENPKLSLFVTEIILNLVSSYKDRANCRLVCYNWIYLIDKYVGMGLKLTQQNKANLFDSDLIRCCPSMTVCGNGGMTNWYVCPFSTTLKSMEVRGNILNDNWKLLLSSCEALEFLTITTHGFRKGKFRYKNLDFEAPAQPDRIDHNNLKRIVIRVFGMSTSTTRDIQSVSNMLDTIGETPRLKQIVINFDLVEFEYCFDTNASELLLQQSLRSFVGRNSTNGMSLGLIRNPSAFSDMKLFDRYLSEGKRCLVNQIVRWPEIYGNMVGETLDTVYCATSPDVVDNVNFNTLVANVRARSSLSLTKLHVTTYGGIFDCGMLFSLRNLTELAVYSFQEDFPYLRDPVHLTNIPSLAEYNRKLEYLLVSTKLSRDYLLQLFQVPQIKELHIRKQKCAKIFTRQHFDAATNHANLKIILLSLCFEKKWNKFSKSRNNILEQSSRWGLRGPRVKIRKPDPNCITYLHFRMDNSPRVLYVATQDGGYERLASWSKSSCFCVYNKDKATEQDLARVGKNL